MITADFVGAPRDAASPNRLRLFIAAAGAAMACLGLVVIVGWHVGSTVLIRLLPSLAAMQYATALGFLAAGLSLVFFSRGRRVAAAGLAALVAALGAATLLHYDAGMDLGPLKAMLVPDLEAGALHPGRTGTGTALAFLLSGAALTLCGMRQADRWGAGVVGIFGAVVLGLGVVALSGYVVKPGSPHGWSEFTQMALHTSVGVVALGCALLALALYCHARVSAGAPRWLAVAAGIGALTLVVAIWHSLLAEDARQMRTSVELAVDTIADHLSTELRGDALALERMARRWNGDGVEAGESWAADARTYIAHQPAYQALAWIDQEYRFRWVEGAASAGRLRDARIGPETALGQILAALKDRDRPSLQWMADLPAGGPGVLLVVPLRDVGEFHGFMAGFLSFPDFVDNTVLHSDAARNTVVLYEGRNEIYRHEGIGVEAASAWRAEARVDSHGLAWRATMLPGAEMLGQLHGTVANILVAVGAALSVVLGLSVHFAQTAARRAHVVEDAHRELKENIRERMAAEGAAARLGHILDHSFNEIYLFDADSLRFVQVNQGAQRNLGYSMEELRGMTPLDIKPEFDHAQFADLIAPLRSGAKDQLTFETVHRRKDGTDYPIEVLLQLSRTGARPIFAAIIQDITARRRSQEALRESERRYRNLIEDSALGVVVHRDGRPLFANRAAAEMLGYETPAELLAAEDVHAWVAPDDLARTTGYAEARMRGEEAPTDYEFRAIRKDGSLAWLRNQVVVVTWDGEPAIQTHWTDVTKRKQAEERAKRAQDRLIDAIECLPVAFILYDSEDRSVLTNSLYAKWFPRTAGLVKRGAHVEEIIRRNVETATIRWNDDDLEAYARERLAHFRRAEGANIVSYSDGRVFQTIDRKTADGGTVGIRVDITELKQREAELRLSEQRFKDLAEAAADWFWETDTNDRLTASWRETSDGVEHNTFGHLGATRAEIYDGPTDTEAWRTYFASLEARNPIRDFVYPLKDTSGAVRWMRVNGKPRYGPDSTFLGYYGSTRDITAQVEAEESAKQAQQRLAVSVEALSEQFVLFDADDRLVLGNKAWRDFNQEIEESIRPGTPYLDFSRAAMRAGLYPDAVGREEEWLRQRLIERKNPSGPQEFERSGNRWTLVNDQRLPDGGVATILTDITEIKQREAALLESEARAARAHDRLRDAIESLEEGFALFDSDDNLALTNSRWLDHYEPVREVFQIGANFHDIQQRLIATGTIVAARGREQEWVRERTARFENPSGPIERQLGDDRWLMISERRTSDGGTVVVTTDITALKERETALRESEARLRRAITDAPIPIMLHAEGGEVLLISREWTEITGYASAEIPTLGDWMRKAYGALHEERKAHVDALHGRDVGSRDGEFEIMTGSGETRVWDFSNGPLGAMPDGRRIMISMAIDVTERKVAETEIKKLNEGLEKRVEERTAELRAAQGELVKKERLATLGQLTATVSHELRNPLAAMRASAHVIRVALNDNQDRARRAVERVERSIVRCDHIIDELLDYTRIRDLDPTATFLDEWLDEVIGEQDTPDRVRVARERGLSGATAMIDRDRLRRAVINVFDNACQAMVEDEDDAGDHCLTVRTHQSDEWIDIEFHDDGPGIPPDVEAKIFEPLFSTKGFGVGLGLPVGKQIMEQHGGTVEVETEPGRGTCVRLRLPCPKNSKQRTRTKAL